MAFKKINGSSGPVLGKTGRGAPTIRDVAGAASVSIGTVSKALNNNGSLRKETREFVIKIAAEMGFRRNDLAQSLHRGTSASVGLISNDSFGRFTMPIAEGLEACLAESASRSSCAMPQMTPSASASTSSSC